MRPALKKLLNKQGSGMAEAAIALPIAILAAVLLLRMFIFCLEVLTAGIKDHREALDAERSYNGAVIRTYHKERDIKLLKGGLLRMDAVKKLEVKTYLINEDFLVRSGEAID